MPEAENEARGLDDEFERQIDELERRGWLTTAEALAIANSVVTMISSAAARWAADPRGTYRLVSEALDMVVAKAPEADRPLLVSVVDFWTRTAEQKAAEGEALAAGRASAAEVVIEDQRVFFQTPRSAPDPTSWSQGVAVSNTQRTGSGPGGSEISGRHHPVFEKRSNITTGLAADRQVVSVNENRRDAR